MRTAVVVLVLVSSTICAGTASAAIVVDLNGGGDYLTISEGIAAASSGDTVLVAPGTYVGAMNRSLSFLGREIVLSRMPTRDDPVIIDAEHAARCFLFLDAEGPGARVQGITIQRGHSGYGGGVYCGAMAAPTFVDCEFVECTATAGGGMECANGAHPTLIRCAFRENVASGGGGGIRVTNDSSVDVQDCRFKGNSADLGGGMMARDGSFATVDGTLFEDNTAEYSAGLRCEDSTVAITNSIFSRNDAYSGGGLGSGNTGQVALSHCVFYANTASFRGAGYACGTPADVQYCTFVLGVAPTGSGIFCGPPQGDMDMTNSIVAFGEGPAMTCDEGGAPTVTRCCFYDNAGGNDPCGTFSNILYENPYFCGLMTEDLTLNAASVCLPANNPWGVQMGAFGQGCEGPVPVEPASWATIKAMYR
jgi:predicted outer membrane repeat protein